MRCRDTSHRAVSDRKNPPCIAAKATATASEYRGVIPSHARRGRRSRRWNAERKTRSRRVRFGLGCSTTVGSCCARARQPISSPHERRQRFRRTCSRYSSAPRLPRWAGRARRGLPPPTDTERERTQGLRAMLRNANLELPRTMRIPATAARRGPFCGSRGHERTRISRTPCSRKLGVEAGGGRGRLSRRAVVGGARAQLVEIRDFTLDTERGAIPCSWTTPPWCPGT